MKKTILKYEFISSLLFVVLFISNLTYSQPISDFTNSDSLCLNQNLSIINSSTNSTSYQWDFYLEDLGYDPVFESTYTIAGGSLPIDTDIIFNQGNWYGFSCDFLNNKLYRLDFENSLENTPTHTDLGNPGNLFSQPYQAKLLNFNNTWHAFIVNFANNKLIRITFGNGLNMAPTSTTDLGNFGLLNKPMGLSISLDDGNYIITVSNNSGNDLTLINFGNSPVNNPTSTDAISIGDDIGLSGSGRLSILKGADTWYGLICSVNNGKVFKVDFGTALFDTDYASTEVASMATPNGVEFIKEGINYIGYVVGNTTGFYRLSFGQDISTPPTVTAIGKAGIPDQFRSLKIVRQSPGWYGFTNSRNGSLLSKVSFSDHGSRKLLPSTYPDPQNVSYDSAGTFAMELTAFSSDGNYDIKTQVVIVKDVSAPSISFTSNNACIANVNTFSAPSDNSSITAWNWDFGDVTGTASGQNVNYQYADTGNYEIKLSVDAVNGCSNTITKNISIYNPPQVGFTFGSEIFCSNSPMDFTNNTLFYGPDSILTYQWNMNDEAMINEANPSYTFTSGGDKNITLSAAIPGCSSEASEIINITPGPLTSFDFSGVCTYDEFSFANTTTGDDITNFQWDFGDGYYSTNDSPNHQYEAGGNYIASLTASNTLGCNTILEQVVSVRYIPELFFTNDLACSDNSVSLNDQSSVINANITKRYWAMEKDDIAYAQSETGPSTSFDLEDPGIYLATLIAESNYGCLDTLIQQIEILQSPVADFSFNNTCFGDSVIFSQTSVLPDGSELLSADWLIDGNVFSSENINHKYQNTGDHTIELYVRSDNYCADNISKTITVNPLPTIDFILSSNCEDQLSSISSSTVSPMDPVISYNWLINNKAVSNQENFQYEFKKADDYSLSLTVFTENDCFSSLDKNVIINPSPVSKFDVFPSFGASPLDVQFTDRSQGAEHIAYLFNQNSEDGSSDDNPNYIYTQVGNEIATQIVENKHGCTDTSTQSIEVVVPLYDITITNVSVEVLDEELKFIVGIQNNGTIIVNNPTIQVKIADKVTINQKVETTLMPGEQNEYTIDFNVVKTSNEPLDYICFSITDVLGSYIDTNPHDNEECINIDQSFNVLEPFPNPSRIYVHVPIILPSSGDCDLQMIGEQGKIVYTKKFSDLKSGLNMIQVDLTPYRKGIYLLTVRLSDFETTKKIVVQ